MEKILLNGNITAQVLVVFSLAFFGVIARKFRIIKDEAKDSFADVIFNITLPSLVFISLTSGTHWEQLISGIITPLLSLVFILIALCIAIALSKIFPMASNRVPTFLVLCIMPNTGFIGFPVILSILGKIGLAYAVLYDIGVTFAFCSIAMLVLKKELSLKNKWEVLLNPSLLAVFAGLLLNKLGVRIPEIVLEPLRIMGESTIPLAMLLMGFILGGIKFQMSLLSWELALVCLVKLVLYPLIAYLVLLMMAFSINPVVRWVIIIEAAMPSMASTIMLVEKYGGDEEFATMGILTTSMLSIVSIPFILSLLGY